MSSALLSQEREAWSRERSRLEKALQQAQAQTARLRGEVRSEALSDVTGPDLDNAALKVSSGGVMLVDRGGWKHSFTLGFMLIIVQAVRLMPCSLIYTQRVNEVYKLL